MTAAPDTETSARNSELTVRKAHQFRRWIQAATSPETPTPNHRATPARAALPNCPATGTADSSAIGRGLVERTFSRAGYTRNSQARRVRSDLTNTNCDAQHFLREAGAGTRTVPQSDGVSTRDYLGVSTSARAAPTRGQWTPC